MNHSNFQFHLQKRRPLWKDMLYFVLSVLFFWMAVHLFLNFNAYAQIATFKGEQLKAEVFTTAPDVLENLDTQKKPLVFHAQNIKNPAQEVFQSMEVYPSDNRLYIPRIHKNVPLVIVPTHTRWDQLEKNIQQGLQNGAVVHPVSHEPGQLGNFFITGHSSYYKWDPGRFKDIFALLHEVNTGDIVEVYWQGKKYTYTIRSKDVVPPTETSVLDQPENTSIVTLMTCTPVGTNKNRLVLVGDLISSNN